MPGRKTSNSFSLSAKPKDAFTAGLRQTAAAVQCNSEGYTTAAIDIMVSLWAWCGDRDVLGDCTVTAVKAPADTPVSVSTPLVSGTRCLRLQAAVNTRLEADVTVTVTFTHTLYGVRHAVFTLTRAVAGVNPSHQEVQEAWGSSATEHPTDGWANSTPANTQNLPYLWRRTRTATYDVATGTWTYSTWAYVRLNGTNGTSITPRGTVVAVAASATGLGSSGLSAGDLGIVAGSAYLRRWNGSAWSALAAACADGDCYTVSRTCQYDGADVRGHLFMWSSEAARWIDLGQFQGQPGDTYYTHVAWADSVTLAATQLGIPAGQTSRPNASAVGNFSVAPMEGYDWMGTLVNTSATDPTSADKLLYTWKHLQGPKGDAAVDYQLLPSHTALHFTRQADGTLTPEGYDVGCGYTRTEGSLVTVVPGSEAPGSSVRIGSADYALFYRRIAADGSYVNAGTGRGWYWMSGLAGYVLHVPADSGWTAVQFALAPATPTAQWTDGDILRIVTIPVTRDGHNGLNAPYDVVSYGRSRSRTSYGGTDLDAATGWVSVAPQPTDTYPYIWQRTQHYTWAGQTPQLQSTSYVCLSGAVGRTGGTGPLCYLTGPYRPDVDYASTATATPAVEVPVAGSETSELWYLVAATNVVGGRHIAPTDANQAVWARGLSDYNLVRTRYLFADFARVGSAVASGDWLFSARGRLAVLPPAGDTFAVGSYVAEGQTSQPWGELSKGMLLLAGVDYTFTVHADVAPGGALYVGIAIGSYTVTPTVTAVITAGTPEAVLTLPANRASNYVFLRAYRSSQACAATVTAISVAATDASGESQAYMHFHDSFPDGSATGLLTEGVTVPAAGGVVAYTPRLKAARCYHFVIEADGTFSAQDTIAVYRPDGELLASLHPAASAVCIYNATQLPADGSYCLTLKPASGTRTVRAVSVRPVLAFTPNTAHDLRTGTIRAARGNFVVADDGSVTAAAGRLAIGADGSVAMQDATIRGSLLYDRVKIIANAGKAPGHDLYDADNVSADTYVKANGTRVDYITRATMLASRFVVFNRRGTGSGYKNESTLILPPAESVAGMTIRIAHTSGITIADTVGAADWGVTRLYLSVAYDRDIEGSEAATWHYTKFYDPAVGYCDTVDICSHTIAVNELTNARPQHFRHLTTIELTAAPGPDNPELKANGVDHCYVWYVTHAG